MNDFEKDLGKALGQNGAFDAEKAREIGAKAVETFGARLRRAERMTWAAVAVCIVVWIIAWVGLIASSSTKAMILCGVFLMISLAGEMVNFIWYWVTDCKLSILQEVRRMQLGMAAADEPAPPLVPKRISGREKTAWLLGAVVVGLLIALALGSILPSYFSLLRGLPMSHTACCTLAEDGSATSEETGSWTYLGREPETSFDVWTAAPSTAKWFDNKGRELPFAVFKEGRMRHFVIQLIDPVAPGEQNTHKAIWKYPALAKKENDVWTLHRDPQFGGRSTFYSETIVLPRGAEIVSTEPESAARFTWNDAPAVRFTGRCGPNGNFTYSVRYRLASEAATQKAEQ